VLHRVVNRIDKLDWDRLHIGLCDVQKVVRSSLKLRQHPADLYGLTGMESFAIRDSSLKEAQ
jgi:hypothetical protein